MLLRIQNKLKLKLKPNKKKQKRLMIQKKLETFKINLKGKKTKEQNNMKKELH